MITNTTLTENVKLIVSRGRGRDKGNGHTPKLLHEEVLPHVASSRIQIGSHCLLRLLRRLLPPPPLSNKCLGGVFALFSFLFCFFIILRGETVFRFTLQSNGGGNEPNRCLPTPYATTHEEDQIKRRRLSTVGRQCRLLNPNFMRS